jgi:aspartyl-tRNA(Asn)/glutamyl-tRNA(Gln) amidotransferase subunit B
MAELVKLVDGGKINITLAQQTLSKMLEEGKPVSAYISKEDTLGISDEELTQICKKAIAENGKIVEDFLGGKDKAICGLYGFIKRATGGKADIKKADEILRKLIKENN